MEVNSDEVRDNFALFSAHKIQSDVYRGWKLAMFGRDHIDRAQKGRKVIELHVKDGRSKLDRKENVIFCAQSLGYTLAYFLLSISGLLNDFDFDFMMIITHYFSLGSTKILGEMGDQNIFSNWKFFLY